jgi:hypothetical protein
MRTVTNEPKERLTVQMVEYVGSKTHNPETSRKVLRTKEAIAKTELILGGLMKCIERAYLEQMNKGVNRGYGQEREQGEELQGTISRIGRIVSRCLLLRRH